MNSSANKSRPSRRPRNNRRRQKTTSAQKIGDYGKQVSPPVNPPDTVAQPWWPVIISSIRSPGDYTFTQLVADFQNQLNSDKYTFNSTSFNSDQGTPFRCQFRFQRIDVWNLTGRLISFTVWEIPEQTYEEKPSKIVENDQLGSWVDCGGINAFPAVGYIYPSSHHRRIYRPDPRTAEKKIVTTAGGQGDRVLYHIHLLWKSDSYPKFSTVEQPHLPILRKLERSNNTLLDINKSIRDGQQSTIGNAIAKGVPVAAHYVINAAAGQEIGLAHTGGVTTNGIVQEASRSDNREVLLSAILDRLTLLEEKFSTTSSIADFIEVEEAEEPVSRHED